MSFTTVTVTGTFLHPDGSPAAGTITFTLSSELQDPASNDVCAPIPVRATLDDSGSFSVDLTANDDVGVQPTGSVYNIVERIRHAQRRNYSVSLSHTTPNVQLADLAPVADGTVTYGVTSVNGKTGDIVLVATDIGGLGTAATHDATDFDTFGAAVAAAAGAQAAAESYTDGETARAEAAEAAVSAAVTAEQVRAQAVEAAKADLVGGLVPIIQIPPAAFDLVESVATVADMLVLPVGGKGALVRVADDGDGSPALFLLPAGADPTNEADWVELAMDADAAAAAAQAAAESYADAIVAAEAARAQAAEAANTSAAVVGPLDPAILRRPSLPTFLGRSKRLPTTALPSTLAFRGDVEGQARVHNEEDRGAHAALIAGLAPVALLTTKGDLFVFDGVRLTRLPAVASGQFLQSNPASPTGWSGAASTTGPHNTTHASDAADPTFATADAGHRSKFKFSNMSRALATTQQNIPTSGTLYLFFLTATTQARAISQATLDVVTAGVHGASGQGAVGLYAVTQDANENVTAVALRCWSGLFTSGLFTSANTLTPVSWSAAASHPTVGVLPGTYTPAYGERLAAGIWLSGYSTMPRFTGMTGTLNTRLAVRAPQVALAVAAQTGLTASVTSGLNAAPTFLPWLELS